jgi:hypothetical protein
VLYRWVFASYRGRNKGDASINLANRDYAVCSAHVLLVEMKGSNAF